MFVTLTSSPHQIANIKERKNIYLQLTSGTMAYISASRQTLEYQGGLQLVGSDRVLWLDWSGPLWVSGSGTLSVEMV